MLLMFGFHRFQAKGMDIGVTDDSLNGIPYEESSTSSEEEEDGNGRNTLLTPSP